MAKYTQNTYMYIKQPLSLGGHMSKSFLDIIRVTSHSILDIRFFSLDMSKIKKKHFIEKEEIDKKK